MRLSKFLGSVAVLGAAFMGVASTSFANETTVAHCVGTDGGDTEIEVTISYHGSMYLPTVVREAKLTSIQEKEIKFLAINTNASHFLRVDTYGEARNGKGEYPFGFGLAVRNETGYGSLNLMNSPLGKHYRNLPVTCDVF